MERRVNIERCNIPMKQVFSDERVWRAVLQEAPQSIPIPLAEAIRSACLPSSARTLRQYICLAGEERLGDLYLAQLEYIFARADETSPISMEDQYPWLKKENWSLEMRDISYYKVTADLAQEKQINIKRVRWQEQQQILWVEPEENPALPASSEPGSPQTPSALPVHMENRAALLLFIKRLLLEGRADLTGSAAL